MSDEEPHMAPDAATEPVAGEAVAAEPEAAGAASGRRRRVPVAWLVAVLATCVAVVFASLWAPLYLEQRDREHVREVATEMVLHLTTFEGARIDEWVAETQQRATGDYAEQVNRLFDESLRTALAEVQAVSRGRLVNLFVQDVEGGEATVFAVARQTITNTAVEGAVEDELRIQMELRSEDGTWLVSNVEVLGPGGVTPGPGVEEEAAP